MYHNTCWLNKRRKNHYGFNLLKGFAYGVYEGNLYASNGTPKNNYMLVYINRGNGWIECNLPLNHAIPVMIRQFHGRAIAAKNAAYKGSMKEIKDFEADKMKPHGKALETRCSRPYNPIYKDCRNRAYITSRREARVGL